MTEDEDVDLNLNETGAPISMTFTFSEDCWVNIADATGEVIATGVKQQGRVMDIRGIPPVAVTLGAPDNVRISVNGELADITSFQNGKIARFTLPL
jgi:cytoskeleton protein RodZ